MRMKKTIALLLSAALIVALAAGCGGEKTDAPSGSAELDRTLNVATAPPSNLDIQLNSSGDAAKVADCSIFEQLVALNSKGEVVNELCEECIISEDATTYTYKLRKGVKFHNGEEMKAADVVASMNRWIDNASNAQSLVGDARFYEVDEYTAEIKMAQGTAYLNQMIGGLGQHAVIMPASIISATAAGEPVAEYIGTGPYKYAEWKADQYIKLVKYEDYVPYGTEGDFSGYVGYKRATFDEVYFYFCADNATISAGIQTGEYDISENLELDDIATFEGNSDFVVNMTENEMPMLIFNKKGTYGGKQLVRQAIQAALDCNKIMYSSYGSEDNYSLYSCYMFESSGVWYTEAGSEFYNQADTAKAKELFAQAGWTDNDTFRLLVANDDMAFYTQAQAIQAQLKEMGINCELMAHDWSTFVDIRNNQPEKYDAFITSFSSKVLPNMNLFLSATWAGWCEDARVQDDLASIAADTNLEHAAQTWEALQQYMYEEYVPVVKFGNNMGVVIQSSKLTDVSVMENLVWVNAVKTK